MTKWLSLMAIAIAGTACIVQPANGPTQGTYEVCTATEQCADPNTTCVTASVTSDGFTGTYCSAGCNPNTGCPDDGTGIAAVCVLDSQGGGQCYAGCPGNTGCPYNEVCSTIDGTVLFCVP